MPTTIDIKGRVAGDTLRFKATVPDIPAGQTLVKVWLTVKRRRSLADDAVGVIQKIITSGFTHTGTDPVTCQFNVDLSAAETAQLGANITYEYDIQVMTSAGLVDTPVDGQIVFKEGVTSATS